MADLTTSELYKIQFPDSTEIGVTNPSAAQLTSYISIVSEVMQQYLQRDLESKLRSEWHNTFEDNVVILNEYPVTQIYGIIGGKQEWAQLDLSDSDDVVSLNMYNDSDNEPSIDIITNMDTILDTLLISDYDTIEDLMIAIQGTLEYGPLTDGSSSSSRDVYPLISSTYRINSVYVTQNLAGLQSLSQTQGNNNSTFQFYGIDKNNSISWTREDDINIILNQRTRVGSNSVLIRYVAGYTLPVTTDIGTLPYGINDVVNRIINGIFIHDSDQGPNLNYHSEKLGNASYTNWDYMQAMNSTFIIGLIDRYKSQLDMYRKKDVAFY